MFSTAVRWLHKVNTQNPHFRKMGIASEELQTQKVLKIVREHGPIRPGDCWKHAEAAGIKSKIHMKKLLLWLRGKNLIFPKCVHTTGDKKNQHDLVFYWTLNVVPKLMYPKRNQQWHDRVKRREKGEKEQAQKALGKARKLAKARRLKEKEDEIARTRFSFMG